MTPFFVSPQNDNGYDVEDYYNIDPRYGTMEDLAELARMSGMSRATFFRRFREFYGCTPIQYRDNLLIFQAKHLLVYSALRITEIADQMGFPDQFYFCKFFRARTGCSPSRFRLRVRNRNVNSRRLCLLQPGALVFMLGSSGLIFHSARFAERQSQVFRQFRGNPPPRRPSSMEISAPARRRKVRVRIFPGSGPPW